MKKIPLTQGKVALVDDRDFEKLNRHKWNATKHRNTYYARRNTKDLSNKTRQTCLRMHRVILGAKKGDTVDHINGNGLDNRRENLRIVSLSLNNLNRRLQANNTSGFTGVTWCNHRNKWRVHTSIDGKKKSLGRYDTKEEASAVYEEHRKKRLS